MTAQQSTADVLDAPNSIADLISILRSALRNLSLDLYVARPATVVAFDPVSKTATVSLGYLPVEYAVDGTEVPREPQVLPGIPVRQLTGAGGLSYVSVPILPGDTGHVHFSDRCLSTWLTQGPKPVDPINARAHDMADCWFEPGLRTTAAAAAALPTDLTGTVIEGALVKFGATAVDFLLKGTSFVTPFLVWLGALNAAFIVWNASAKTPADVVAFLDTMVGPTATFFATSPTWLSTKAQTV